MTAATKTGTRKIKGWAIGPGANLMGANLKHTKMDAGRLVYVKEEGE